MSILIIAETAKNKFKKASLEAISYGGKIARQLNKDAYVLSLGKAENQHLEIAGNYAAKTVFKVDAENINFSDSQLLTHIISQAVDKIDAEVIIFVHDAIGRAVAPRISARLSAGLVSGAIDLPDLSNGFVVKRNVFSGKAFAEYSIQTPKKIISLIQNSIPAEISSSESASVEDFNHAASNFSSRISSIVSLASQEGKISLTEAERVVSAGRGMKGPENWGMIEELAETVNAATACSRPVADIGWRPHHEHVGQTGIAIRPNLYIAVGISGAIQHLAGVNGSKVIVVINKDPEAPFFKAADYGIVGDAFEIVPRLNQALKKFMANS